MSLFILSTTDLTDRTDLPLELLEPLNLSRLSLEAKHKPNKPLGEDGGRCPVVMLPPWSYKSELLTPKPKAYHHLPYRRSPSSPRR